VAIVIDASVAVGWFAPSQSSTLTDVALTAASESGGIVPAHFAIEVLRALRRFERRGLLTQAAIRAGIQQLQELGLSVDAANPIERLTEIQRIALHMSLTAGDAAYLDIAVRNNIPLATRDEALARAAGSMGLLFQSRPS
jgi:predicted nucleic acid-binding protein